MVSPWIRIGNLLNRQCFSFSQRALGCVVRRIEEEMNYEGTPVKAPLATRRRMMPFTPRQCSHPLIEEMQLQAEMEAHGSIWSARGRTVIAMKGSST